MNDNTTVLRAAAVCALREIRGGMVLGLGTGRAAEAFVQVLGQSVADGLSVVAVPTSERTAQLAAELRIPLRSLAEVDAIDVAIDGADEVGPNRDLTKGLGGALLRERVIAAEAARFVILVTPEKLVPRLGTRCPIPVEVVPFAVATVTRRLSALGATVARRRTTTDEDFVTDNQNAILDARFSPIEHPQELATAIRNIPGVVDSGLFLGMASLVVVADPTHVRCI